MEDDLMRLFGGERMKSLMNTLGLPDDQPIEAKMVSKSIESAQKKIEGLNFDTRKHVLEFDDVLNHQRNVIYKRRRKYLSSNEIKQKPEEKSEADEVALFKAKADEESADKAQPTMSEEILQMVRVEMDDLVTLHLNALDELGNKKEDWDNLFKTANAIIQVDQNLINKVKEAAKNASDKEFAVADTLYQKAFELWQEKEKEMGKEVFEGAQRFVALQALDQLWMEHLDTMDHLRDSVRLRGYGQRDPLVEYKKEGHTMFKRLTREINRQIVSMIFHISIQKAPEASVLSQNIQTNLSDGGGISSDPKFAGVGRNDPCPCGSGKKYKKCHGK
jgi:preprotein translocase subunit SecA